jgi:hypothetical protein
VFYLTSYLYYTHGEFGRKNLGEEKDITPGKEELGRRRKVMA